MIAWLANIWHLIKGGFVLAGQVSLDEDDFLRLEWPYDYQEHPFDGDDHERD